MNGKHALMTKQIKSQKKLQFHFQVFILFFKLIEIKYFLDDKKWTPAQIIPDYPSIPLQVLVESKSETGTFNEFFSIYKFKHKIDLEIDDYFLPSGVFCPGLTNTKTLPNIPKSFSFANQLVETIEEVVDKAGRIDTIRVIFRCI